MAAVTSAGKIISRIQAAQGKRQRCPQCGQMFTVKFPLPRCPRGGGSHIVYF